MLCSGAGLTNAVFLVYDFCNDLKKLFSFSVSILKFQKSSVLNSAKAESDYKEVSDEKSLLFDCFAIVVS